MRRWFDLDSWKVRVSEFSTGLVRTEPFTIVSFLSVYAKRRLLRTFEYFCTLGLLSLPIWKGGRQRKPRCAQNEHETAELHFPLGNSCKQDKRQQTQWTEKCTAIRRTACIAIEESNLMLYQRNRERYSWTNVTENNTRQHDWPHAHEVIFGMKHWNNRRPSKPRP